MRLVLVISLLMVFTAFAWSDTVATAWRDIKALEESVDIRSELAEQDIFSSFAAQVDEGNIKAPRKTVFRYVMYPGDYVTGSGVLSDFFPKEYDIFVFVLVGDGNWYMTVEDC